MLINRLSSERSDVSLTPFICCSIIHSFCVLFPFTPLAHPFPRGYLHAKDIPIVPPPQKKKKKKKRSDFQHRNKINLKSNDRAIGDGTSFV